LEENHRGVPDHGVFESSKLRVELATKLVRELDQGVLPAPLQELRKLGSEAEKGAGTTREEVGSLEIPFLELLQVSAMLHAKAEGRIQRKAVGLTLRLRGTTPVSRANGWIFSEGRRRVSASSTSPGWSGVGRTG
jgi:hypothetical protein